MEKRKMRCKVRRTGKLTYRDIGFGTRKKKNDLTGSFEICVEKKMDVGIRCKGMLEGIIRF